MFNNHMQSHFPNLGKLSIAILEHLLEPAIGKNAIDVIKAPVAERQLLTSLTEALEHTERLFIKKHGDTEVCEAILNLPLANLPSVSSAVQDYYSRPNDPALGQVLREQLKIIGSTFSPERIEAGVITYLTILRDEIVNLPGSAREVLQAHAVLRMADTLDLIYKLQKSNEHQPRQELQATNQGVVWPVSTITSAREATLLIQEAVFVRDLREWPGNKIGVSRILRELERGLAQPIFLDANFAHKLLSDARSRAHQIDENAKHTSTLSELDKFKDIRRLLEPLITQLPSDEAYLAALEYIAPELRGPLLEKEYYRAHNDFVAWACLLFLRDLGERETLLKLLKLRLQTIPPWSYPKAYDATWWLAKEFLRDEFPSWWELEIGDDETVD